VSHERRRKLIDLGAESLADALLKIAEWDDHADNLLRRMSSTRAENLAHFKEKLVQLSKPHKFAVRRRSADIARDLQSMLEDLRAGVDDPRMGVQLTLDFFRIDNSVFQCCDASADDIGWIYTYDARCTFVSFASRCDDKRWIADLVLEVIQQDEYALRTSLIDSAVEYLPEHTIRLMMDRIREIAERMTEEYERRRWYRQVESLARQISDAAAFEEARLYSDPKASDRSCIDIARVYLESGDARTALSWMNRLPDTGSFLTYDRDGLLLDIHRKLGNHEHITRITWKVFKEHRSPETLGRLLDEIGQDQQKSVVETETRAILEAKRFSYTDAGFLVDLGQLDEAESYLFKWRKRIDGELYHILVPMAEKLHEHRRFLTATLLYRSLLDSILERARWKAYSHGREYLGVLIELAQHITDWKDIPFHESYVDNLLERHSRKRSFWQCRPD
jgi:hypothetical protein